MPNVDARLQNYAGYMVGQPAATIGADLATTVLWYDSMGPGRATTYYSAPAYLRSNVQGPITRSRDFLYMFLGACAQYPLAGLPAARTAWDKFNGQIGEYISAVNDYVNSGAGSSWQGPFPATLVGIWQRVVGQYVAAWNAARTVAQQLLAYANGTNASQSMPSNAALSLPSPAVAATNNTINDLVRTLPPEMQAQVVGTQTTAVKPVATPTGGATNLPSAAAANAVQTAIPAGASIDVPRVPSLPINAATVHTPIYQNPMFYVALGGAVVLAGLVYLQVRK